MPKLTPQQLRDLARLGAEARLAQLDMEVAAIRSTYRELPRTRTAAEPAMKQAGRATRRRRYRMSPEARKAAAERMRKYWADRKAAQPTAAHAKPRRARKAARGKRALKK